MIVFIPWESVRTTSALPAGPIRESSDSVRLAEVTGIPWDSGKAGGALSPARPILHQACVAYREKYFPGGGGIGAYRHSQRLRPVELPPCARKTSHSGRGPAATVRPVGQIFSYESW
jgi:hypothetical protein